MNGKPALIPFGDAGAATCEEGVCGAPTAAPAEEDAKSHPIFRHSGRRRHHVLMFAIARANDMIKPVRAYI